MDINQAYRAIRNKDGFEVIRIPKFGENYFPKEYQSEGRTFYKAHFEINNQDIVIYVDQLMYGDIEYQQIEQEWKRQFNS
ncbi:hypothetical protein EXE30_06805 [Acinetobacter halotolerans]|uniref:Uncharacterized protein n=1 Tax=Acinetobacter halotolerans TaxID=1752076 RepID=A0A4Q6XHL0_9GAMM|nr:hypothetical protein [Acinetobacter halotolerans]RZF53679.1 hypothetical protein EXE30_06805 [Acinetobacter halotolerans]